MRSMERGRPLKERDVVHPGTRSDATNERVANGPLLLIHVMKGPTNMVQVLKPGKCGATLFLKIGNDCTIAFPMPAFGQCGVARALNLPHRLVRLGERWEERRCWDCAVR